MTDSPKSSASDEFEGSSWAAFDDSSVPAATNEKTTTTTTMRHNDGDEDPFGEKPPAFGTGNDDEGEEDDDEWNDFEFASAPATAPAVAEISSSTAAQPALPKTDTTPEPTIASSSSSQIADPSLSIETVLGDLGQIIDSCWTNAVAGATFHENSNDVESCSGGDETGDAQRSSDDHRLSLLSDLLGENGDPSVSSKKSDREEPCDTADDVLAFWTSLRLIEEASALKYQWAEARAYERHVASLRMDLKLAKIRNPKLPAFAWQLSNSALTPERPACISSTSMSSGGSNAVIPSPSNTGGCDQQQQNNTLANDCYKSANATISPMPPSVVGTSPVASGHLNGAAVTNGAAGAAVPSVQFDWGSSGLKNPLSEGIVDSNATDFDYCSSKSASSIIANDLSYLVTSNTTGVVGNSDTWKTDSKGLVLDDDGVDGSSSLDDAAVDDENHSAPSIAKSRSSGGVNLLEKLMNSNHRTTPTITSTVTSSSNVFSTSSSSESVLSDQARRLLDNLPDLSFMLSPVLMFPIREDVGRPDGGDDIQL